MTFRLIKHRLVDKILKKQLPHDQPTIVPISWDNVKNMGLIFQADDQALINEVEELVSLWESEGKKVQVLMYMPNTKKILSENQNTWLSCTKKDFSFSGIPKSATIQQFIQQPFDLLVDLNTSGQVRLYSISVLSRAMFKIGADLPFNKHLPFSVDISRASEPYTIFKLGQELINQLKKIQFA